MIVDDDDYDDYTPVISKEVLKGSSRFGILISLFIPEPEEKIRFRQDWRVIAVVMRK